MLDPRPEVEQVAVLATVQVDYHVAVVGHERLAVIADPDDGVAESLEPLLCQLPAERQYLDRNRDIVAAVSQLIATPSQDEEVVRSGTWATVRYGLASGLDVIVLRPSDRP